MFNMYMFWIRIGMLIIITISAKTLVSSDEVFQSLFCEFVFRRNYYNVLQVKYCIRIIPNAGKTSNANFKCKTRALSARGYGE